MAELNGKRQLEKCLKRLRIATTVIILLEVRFQNILSFNR